MTSRRLTWLDVFSADRLAGNQLAVVHDADAVPDDVQGRFAAETNLSETTFVQAATADGATYTNRIWMPDRELPFAGHPSLGTAVAVALARGEDEVTYVQQTQVGLQPIDVRRSGTTGHASMLQEPAVFGAEIDPVRVMAAVGLSGADAAGAALPCQIVSTGVAQLIAPIADADALGRVRIDATALDALVQDVGSVVLYLAALNGDSARVRGIFTQDGLPREDPGTGSAAGPLMAYAHARTGVEQLTVTQGVEMRRPCRIDCSVEGDRVRVGGDVVVVFEAQIVL
jgi:trans-2,3-dihydro-3-hydroxyanthranilate isomerase